MLTQTSAKNIWQTTAVRPGTGGACVLSTTHDRKCYLPAVAIYFYFHWLETARIGIQLCDRIGQVTEQRLGIDASLFEVESLRQTAYFVKGRVIPGRVACKAASCQELAC